MPKMGTSTVPKGPLPYLPQTFSKVLLFQCWNSEFDPSIPLLPSFLIKTRGN